MDFTNPGGSYDPKAKEKRLQLVNDLRKSNLPSQHFNFPKSTAQESFAQSSDRQKDLDAIKQRKSEADEIFARVRGAKPNFSMGRDKLDYVSENKGRIQ